jgi:hypothetical protein
MVAAQTTIPLSPYEAEQVRQIADWKAQSPHALGDLLEKATSPLTRVIEHAIPAHAVRHAVARAYDVGELLAAQDDIKRHAGVQDIEELKRRSLEECDRLVRGVGQHALILGVVEGALTGTGGFLTAALDVPLLFILALRTIMRIGHCYGYPLHGANGRRLVLGILIVAASNSPEKKRTALCNIREVEDWLLAQAEEEIVEEEAIGLMVQVEVFDDVPGLGALAGGLLNFSFLRKVDIAAHRVFQERWLRDNGKVNLIEPALALPPVLRRAGDGWFSRALYLGCYGLGYGAGLPAGLVALAWRDNRRPRPACPEHPAETRPS